MTITRWLSRFFFRSREAVKFISFPKTGNTWIRVLLGRYFQLLWSLDELMLLEEAEREIFAAHRTPALDVSHGVLEWTCQTANDLTYANSVQPYVDVPVVVLTRHPLDTLLSLYMHNKYQAQAGLNGRLVGSFADFVNNSVMGLDKFIRFHNLWIGKPHLMIARYEDMRADTEQESIRMLKFIGAPLDRSVLRNAIEYASFESMKAMERSKEVPRYKSSGFQIFATGNRQEPNAYHVREGRIGGFREHLTVGQEAEFLARIRRDLSRAFGYGNTAAVRDVEKLTN